MKVWQEIAAALSLSLLMPWLSSSTALAQATNQPVSILSDILVPILVIIDKLLDYWVNSISGNSLTDPWGTGLVTSLATIIQQMTTFFAQFSLLLPANNM